MPQFFPTWRRRMAVLAMPLTLGACTTLSNDAGLGYVNQIAKEQSGHELNWKPNSRETDETERQVDALLSEPLTVDRAVQVALLNNPDLQAAMYALPKADADYVQAGRLSNPTLSFSRLQNGDQREFDRGLSINLAQWLSIPYARQIEAQKFEQTKREVALQMLQLIAETHKAYYKAIAAQQSYQYALQVKDAADAGAVLAQRTAHASGG